MKILIFAVAIFITLASAAVCEDAVTPVLDKIDDLTIRMDSGISLNSYAELLVKIKTDYKKAQSGESAAYNPLFDDRMKEVINILDDYAYVWRAQENDRKDYISGRLADQMLERYSEIRKYGSSNRYAGYVFQIADVKREILSQLREKLDKAKSAHVNGW